MNFFRIIRRKHDVVVRGHGSTKALTNLGLIFGGLRCVNMAVA